MRLREKGLHIVASTNHAFVAFVTIPLCFRGLPFYAVKGTYTKITNVTDF
jgi:hypothetical protein